MGRDNMKNRIWILVVIIISIVGLIIITDPIVFASDGLLTKKEVESYGSQYDLGATRRHDSEITGVYMFYLGNEKVTVQSERMREGKPVVVDVILPFLYKWQRQVEDSVFRVTIGDKKYYYTFVSN